jgi:hypothetical protein
MDIVKRVLRPKSVELTTLEIVDLRAALNLARSQYKKFAENEMGNGAYLDDYWQQEVKACDNLLERLKP